MGDIMKLIWSVCCLPESVKSIMFPKNNIAINLDEFVLTKDTSRDPLSNLISHFEKLWTCLIYIANYTVSYKVYCALIKVIVHNSTIRKKTGPKWNLGDNFKAKAIADKKIKQWLI